MVPDFQKVYATHLIGYFAIIFFYLIIRLLKNILSKSSYQNRTVLFQKTITRLFKSYKVVTLYYFFSWLALIWYLGGGSDYLGTLFLELRPSMDWQIFNMIYTMLFVAVCYYLCWKINAYCKINNILEHPPIKLIGVLFLVQHFKIFQPILNLLILQEVMNVGDESDIFIFASAAPKSKFRWLVDGSFSFLTVSAMFSVIIINIRNKIIPMFSVIIINIRNKIINIKSYIQKIFKSSVKSVKISSSHSELKKYKEMMDEGLISEDDYNEKKKELLK